MPSSKGEGSIEFLVSTFGLKKSTGNGTDSRDLLPWQGKTKEFLDAVSGQILKGLGQESFNGQISRLDIPTFVGNAPAPKRARITSKNCDYELAFLDKSKSLRTKKITLGDFGMLQEYLRSLFSVKLSDKIDELRLSTQWQFFIYGYPFSKDVVSPKLQKMENFVVQARLCAIKSPRPLWLYENDGENQSKFELRRQVSMYLQRTKKSVINSNSHDLESFEKYNSSCIVTNPKNKIKPHVTEETITAKGRDLQKSMKTVLAKLSSKNDHLKPACQIIKSIHDGSFTMDGSTEVNQYTLAFLINDTGILSIDDLKTFM